MNYLTDINLEKVNNLFACLPISSTELGTQMEAPLRDTLGKYKLLPMYRGFERLLYPGVGGNERGLVYNNLAPQGKTGGFVERNEVDWIYR